MVDVVLAGFVLAAGSCLQGAVGFGVSLVSAPLLLLIDQTYVPAPLIIATGVLNLLVARREGIATADPRIRLAIAGQVPGAVVAGAVLAAVPAHGLSILFAATILAAVAVSASGLHPRPTAGTLVTAGAASGFMGTVSGIGGPPMALVYQRADGPTLRGTLARFFLAGTVVSVPTLAAVGKLGLHELAAAALLLPGVVVGFVASGPLVRRLDRRSVRPIVLALSAAAALAVLGREVL